MNKRADYINAIGRMAELKLQIASLQGRLQPLQDELDVLKLQAMAYMQETRSKRSEPVNGLYLVRSEKTNFRIEDQEQAADFIQEQGLDLEEYYKLDAVRVGALAKSLIKETDQTMPGLAVETNEYLSLRETK